MARRDIDRKELETFYFGKDLFHVVPVLNCASLLKIID